MKHAHTLGHSSFRVAAFTMAELMVTVAIISIVSAITINVSSNQWRRERVNTVALELAGWLEKVRGGSLRQTSGSSGLGGCEVTLFDRDSVPAGTSIAQIPLTAPANCAAQNPLPISGFATTADRYTTASSNGSTITFTPRGSVITTGGSSVDYKILLNNSGLMRCVRIVAALGSIRIGSNNNATSIGSTCADSTYGGRF